MSTTDNGEKKRVILLAMDGSIHSDFAFKWYMEHLNRPGDHVILAHCSDYRSYLSVYGGTAMVPGDHNLLTSIIKEEELKIQKTAAILENKIKEANVDGHVLCLTGQPGEAIVAAATKEKVDFIVTGCRGLGQIRRTLMGSVSDFIIHHATMPVLVCRHT